MCCTRAARKRLVRPAGGGGAQVEAICGHHVAHKSQRVHVLAHSHISAGPRRADGGTGRSGEGEKSRMKGGECHHCIHFDRQSNGNSSRSNNSQPASQPASKGQDHARVEGFCGFESEDDDGAASRRQQ